MALHHVQESDGYAEDEEPMLSTSGRGSDGAVDLDSNSAPEDSDETAGLGKELRRLVTLGIPLSTVSLLSYTANIVSLAYVGRLSAHSLAAAVLGNSLFNVTGFSVLMGLSSAMETLCGQNFGAGNYAALGVILQRSLLISGIVFAIIMALWTQMEKLLVLLGQDAAMSILAAAYMRALIPGLACAAINESLKRYLMAQNVVLPETLAMLFATALSPLFNYILVIRAGFGLDGAAWAANAVQLTGTIGISGYMIWRESQLHGTDVQTWHGWSSQCLQGWRYHIAVAAPSVVMMCVEWWAFEAIVLAAGLLPDAELSLAVVGVLLNIGNWLFALPNGLGSAASTRVSNELGAGCPLAAKKAALVASLLALGLMTGFAAMVFAGRWGIAAILTSDIEVQKAVAAVLPISALAIIGDGQNACLSGVVRGAGRQLLGASINVCAYWMLSLPFALTLGFAAGLGVAGLWWGMAATATLQGVALAAVVGSFDWPQEATRAAARMVGAEQGLADTKQENMASEKLELGSHTLIGTHMANASIKVQESQLTKIEAKMLHPAAGH